MRRVPYARTGSCRWIAIVALLCRLPGFACVVLLLASAPPALAQVLIVLSDQSASYQEVADEFRERIVNLVDKRVVTEVVGSPQLERIDPSVLSSYRLVVTVGLDAARAMAARSGERPSAPPTLCLLIPHQAFERIAPYSATGATRDRRWSAVFIDQPLARQLDLIRVALPDKRRIGVLLGPTTQPLKKELGDQARERRLAINIAEVTDTTQVYTALRQILPDSDLLLTLPDPLVINSSTAYGLLLTSYREGRPVIGFSDNLVKAGALLGLFSTGKQQGRQGAEAASRLFAADGLLPAPEYPKYFTIRVNSTVARTLGLKIDDESTLTDALVAGGGRDESDSARGRAAALPGARP